MIKMTREQFDHICPKHSILGQADWFRTKYGCTLIIHNNNRVATYLLEFKTEKEETFFRLQYSHIL